MAWLLGCVSGPLAAFGILVNGSGADWNRRHVAVAAAFWTAFLAAWIGLFVGPVIFGDGEVVDPVVMLFAAVLIAAFGATVAWVRLRPQHSSPL